MCGNGLLVSCSLETGGGQRSGRGGLVSDKGERAQPSLHDYTQCLSSPSGNHSNCNFFLHISYSVISDLKFDQPGYLEGSGAHVLVLGPVSEGGCGVNHIGGTHELLHILGLAHTQNRPDR